MVEISRDPRLQSADRFLTNGSSTIDEMFIDARNFCYVRVRGNTCPIWQGKTHHAICMVGQHSFQFCHFHNHRSSYSLKRMQALP